MRLSVVGLSVCLLLGVGCTGVSPQVPRSRSYPLKDRPDIMQALVEHYQTTPAQRAGALGVEGSGGVELKRVEIFRFTSRANQYVAVCDWEAKWWGDFIVFDFDGGKINWVASIDPEDRPTEQSILEVRPVLLPGFDGPCLEVFGTTHMGHGNFYLYHFDIPNRRMELVLKTFAVDNHHVDGTLIRDGKLLPVYYMPTRFRPRGSVALVGIVDEYAPDAEPSKDAPIKARRAHKLFLYNSSTGRYETNPDDWQGMEPYKGRE